MVQRLKGLKLRVWWFIISNCSGFGGFRFRVAGSANFRDSNIPQLKISYVDHSRGFLAIGIASAAA